MKVFRFIILFLLIAGLGIIFSRVVSSEKRTERLSREIFDSRIDNIFYWVEAAKKGYIKFNPDKKTAPAIFTGSKIEAFGVLTEDSPDIPVTEINSLQSENSVFVDPNDFQTILNSNISTENPIGNRFGANALFSFNVAEIWEGEIEGVGGSNRGDPTTAIGLNGRWFVNYIDDDGGMGISYSDNNGSSWLVDTVTPNPGILADKNHMWIDNSLTSAFQGNLYISWTNFINDSEDDGQIGFASSSDNGQTWNINPNISAQVNAGNLNQGVNIGTGPEGEVYAFWAIYDAPQTDETSIGMAKSFDGGQTWEPATRIINNIRGVLASKTTKDMRVNSFPVCAVDNSEGSNRGAIYVTWANIGVPGENTGNDIDVYVIKSSDKGLSWSDPVRVNQDEAGLGKQHFFPWISCDPSSGFLSLVFYDDRNVSSNQMEVFCANSKDGAQSWEDFKVSDVSFTPAPIPGLAGGYFGDYLGISAQGGWVYPVWTDNRTGTAMAYCSPYQTNPLNMPFDLTGIVDFETGVNSLKWSFVETENFLGFKLYRDGDFLVETTDTSFIDLLPAYGIYKYQITAFYSDNMESGAAVTTVKWGDAQISVDPLVIFENLNADTISTKTITVINTGQLELFYNILALEGRKKETFDYCTATGGGDEFINRVVVGNISNFSASNNYSNYTEQSTRMEVLKSYKITVTNGLPNSDDQCAAWVDWDQNGEFDEEAISFSGSPGNGPYTANIIPPEGAKTGETRMRIRIIYKGDFSPCGNTDYGEVEDYSIRVQSWVDFQPSADTILPGDTGIVNVVFNTYDLDFGHYSATALFSSNSPNTNEPGVDISLLVNNLSVDEKPLDQFVQVYPNPSSGVFKVKLKSNETNKIEILVLNSAGTTVYEKRNILLSGETIVNINISDYSKGVYFLKVSDKEKQFVQKLILQK